MRISLAAGQAAQHTFALPVGVRSKPDVAAILPVEFCHERLVGVPDEQDGRVEGLDLLPPALVGLDADRPAAVPMVPLPFEPWSGTESGQRLAPGDHSFLLKSIFRNHHDLNVLNINMDDHGQRSTGG